MSHYIEIPEPFHLPHDGLKVAAVSLLPILPFVVRAEIRIRVLKVVDRGDDLVETVSGQKLPCLVVVLLSQTKFHSFEYLEFLRKRLAESPAGDESVDSVDLRLLGLYIEHLAADGLKLFLHIRNIKIAMVGETYSSEPFFRRRDGTFFNCGTFSVERELAMTVCIEKHRHEYSIFYLNL